MGTTQAVYNNMLFNGTYKLTVFKDYEEGGAMYWRVLHGMELLEGWDVGEGYKTRKEALDVALGVLEYGYTQKTFLPLIAYQHGDNFLWLCRDTYLKSGTVKSH